MLSILSANIQELCPSKGKYKLDMLKEMANEKGVCIIAITKSHLNNDYHDGEIAINDFTNFRADRCQGTRRGGVINYYIPQKLPHTQR